jgi:hypothetical protein
MTLRRPFLTSIQFVHRIAALPHAHEVLMRTTSSAARSSQIPAFRQIDHHLRRAHADRRAHQ